MNQPSKPDRVAPPWLFPVVALGVIAIAIVVALVVAGGADDEQPDNASDQVDAGNEISASSAEVGPVAVIGDPLPTFDSDDSVDAAVGSPSPGIEATTFSGEAVTVDPADGTGRMIGFFAHWCPHCQREVPTVVDWIDAGRLADGVEVVAVSTSVDSGAPNYPPSEWFAREGFEELTLLDDEVSSLAEGFGLSGFPYWVIIDTEGTVVKRTSGEQTPEQLDEMAAIAAGA
ncbi:MAG: TlpA family protein disulfide reductase [Acidobacteria bacterium]|nr:TlpA family protein disulfide reductase [Acidobacteriota bacterium]